LYGEAAGKYVCIKKKKKKKKEPRKEVETKLKK
jgi:hypothetical protein